MNKKILFSILLVSIVVGGMTYVEAFKNSSIPTVGAAAVDYFLEIEGIDGESVDASHRGAIDVESWSWGATNNSGTLGGGGGSGKVSFQDFHFTAKSSKASPKLMLATATGEHIKKATLSVRKAGGNQQDYYVIKLSDVMVTSYQSSGSGGDVPHDQFSLNFSKIEFEYKPQSADGTFGDSVKASWDLKKGTK